MSPAASAGSPWHYDRISIVLHWTLALLMAFMACVGWYMGEIEHTPAGDRWLALHKSLGMVVLALVAVRMAWRVTHRPKPPEVPLPRWQVVASEAVQWALYACMWAIPLTGLIGAGYQRMPLDFFGIAIPRWVAADRTFAHALFEVHEALVSVTVTLVVLHTMAGLKHLLLDRDGVFERMWFARR